MPQELTDKQYVSLEVLKKLIDAESGVITKQDLIKLVERAKFTAELLLK